MRKKQFDKAGLVIICLAIIAYSGYYILSSLNISLSSSSAQNVQGEGLKNAITAPILVGVTTSKYNQRGWADTIKNEFNSLGIYVPTSVFHPSLGEFEWAQIDAQVNFARRAKLTPVLHSLVYKAPAWAAKLSDAELEAELKRTVEAVMDRYKGKVTHYILVNEAFHHRCDTLLRTSEWSRIGKNPDDYMKLVFKWAKARNPEATLIYNDNSWEEIDCRSTARLEWLKAAKAAGVPIDGVGFQSHLVVDQPIDMASFRNNVLRFRNAGFAVYITELDAWINTGDGVGPKKLEAQASLYENFVRTALDAGVDGINLWNLRDDDDRWVFIPGYSKQCLFDANGAKKPAYFGVQNALK